MAWIEVENEGGVGFAEDFAERASDCVADEAFACELSFGEGRAFGPEAELNVDEEEEAFECGFVELGGVSWRDEVGGEVWGGGVGEDDGPGDVGDFAPEFAVDEVGDAA